MAYWILLNQIPLFSLLLVRKWFPFWIFSAMLFPLSRSFMYLHYLSLQRYSHLVKWVFYYPHPQTISSLSFPCSLSHCSYFYHRYHLLVLFSFYEKLQSFSTWSTQKYQFQQGERNHWSQHPNQFPSFQTQLWHSLLETVLSLIIKSLKRFFSPSPIGKKVQRHPLVLHSSKKNG